MKRIILYSDCFKTSYASYQNIVVVGGCFDIIHFGHIHFLAQAQKCGDYLIVFLEGDEFIKEVKKHDPIHKVEERAFMLSQLRCVDQVVILPRIKEYKGYEKLVSHMRPSVIAVTAGDPQIEKKRMMVEKIGGKVVIVTKRIPHTSSTLIRKKLEDLE